MRAFPASSAKRQPIIVGLGKSGLSMARFMAAHGQDFLVVDSRENPPGLAALRRNLPQVEVQCGPLDPKLLASASGLYLSPGLSPQLPELAEARARGIKFSGDIQLFVDYAKAPLVAITGSNGKSTVTTLVGEMARAVGKKVAVGGNLGVPALELLDDEPELYVLELSSFQLELVASLHAEVACILNLSEDHMNRYGNLADYQAAKQRIYLDAHQAVVNRQDATTAVPAGQTIKIWSFGLDAPSADAFGIIEDQGKRWLAFGAERLLASDELRIHGAHNQANALAALAIGRALGWPWAPMLQALREFPGLPHRCQWVAECGGVAYFNDSKATNVGAALAAIEGLASDIPGRLVLIAGGDGKGADFAPLAGPVAEHCRAVLLIGRDAKAVAAVLVEACEVRFADSLEQAVAEASRLAQSGDAVLLAPACASLDMFSNFEERGTRFCTAVEELATC